MKTFKAKDLKSFHNFVKSEVVPLVKPKTLFLLSGDLGAGKTELVKTVAEAFKSQAVQSPTFAFHHLYQIQKMNLHHVDLYRLKSEEDLESIGFWDLFENQEDVIFVEWSNLINDQAWPWGWDKIKIEILKSDANQTRDILLSIF